VTRALRPPPPPPRTSALGKFFGVAADPRTYGALFYMLLSLLTGIFYFTWVVTGVSLSAGLLVLIIGIPVLLLFLMSVRLWSLVEGRIVEALLGVRMPRRPSYTQRDKSWLVRLKELFTDSRTWTTMLYFVLMLPLGIVYFTVAVVLPSTSLALVLAPFAMLFGIHGVIIFGTMDMVEHPWAWPLCFASGVALLFATLHLVRGLGQFHGWLAKHLLVRDAVV
jgi:hypothetical protein